MNKFKKFFSFIVFSFVNILLFVLYLEYTKNLVLIDDESKGIVLLAYILVIFILMFILSGKAKEVTKEEDFTVEYFDFDGYRVEVEIIILKMYDIIKDKSIIKHADIFLLENKNGYKVKMEINVENFDQLGLLAEELKKEIEEVFEFTYKYKGKVETEIEFKLTAPDKKVVPESIKKDIEEITSIGKGSRTDKSKEKTKAKRKKRKKQKEKKRLKPFKSDKADNDKQEEKGKDNKEEKEESLDADAIKKDFKDDFKKEETKDRDE